MSRSFDTAALGRGSGEHVNVAARCVALSLLAPSGAAAQEPIRELSLDVVEELGREIYRRDMAASVATDVMLEQRLDLDEYPLRGWVVTEDADGLLVTFIGEYEGAYKAVFDVRPDERGARRFALAGQRALSSGEAAQFRARTTAQSALEEPCSERYNSVVLEDPESDGWIVYWLAATTQPGAMVVGGHYRVTVSAGGEEIVAADRLSRSCMTIEPADEETAAAVVTHLVGPTPVETHVFVSLLHRKPIFVLTEDETIWAVEGDSIREVEDSERQ
jgi:hypothetical protein